MSEGPTTVGSIDAKLTLDASEFDRKADEAKVTAHELGALSPDVKVDADVSGALAKFGEVTAAEHTMSAATDNDTQSTGRNTQANNQRVSGLQVLIGMAPLILAAAAPIGAAAIGLGTAFGVMAGAGVAAVAGIKDEMAQGTVAGTQYAIGLSTLKTGLDGLEHTAAISMLGSFNQSVGDINAKMPFLNGMVGMAAQQLGDMGGIALRGVLNGLQAMNPLIVQSGAALSDFVGWLANMTSSNGFTQFISYAMSNLPPVMTLIEGLVTLAGNILAAFAPMGPVVIGVLTGITNVLNSLPLPVLAGLVTAAVGIQPAFALARTAVSLFGVASATAAGEVTLFGMAANLAIPVVGIITAAVAGIGMVMATSALSTQKATKSTEDYSQALRDDNLAIGEHVAAQATKALADDGALKAAQQLHINTTDVTNAVLGQGDAAAKVAEQIKALEATYSNANNRVGAYRAGTADLTDAQKANKAAVDILKSGMESESGAVKDQLDQQKRLKDAQDAATTAQLGGVAAVQQAAAAYGMTVPEYLSATQAQDGTAASTEAATAAMQLQNDAAGILKASLDKLNGKAISAADAQNAFDSSLVNMGDHVDKTGKKITFTTTSITDMSSASVALRGQLNGQVSTLQGVVEANGGFANSTGKAREQMVTMRQQIIDNAVAHGVDRDAVTQYIDKILQIPDKVPPTKLDVDAAAAAAKLEAFQQQVNQLHGKTVQITTDYVSNGKDTGVANTTNIRSTPGIVQYHAGGGQVANYLAGGGFPGAPHGTDTQAAWLTPGEIVMNTSAVASLGAGNLLAANRTGQWPAQAQQGSTQPVVVNLVLDGRIIDSRTVNLVNGVINSLTTDANYRRVGV